MSTITYKDAGVDITAGNKVVELIKQETAATYNKNVLSALGGFAGLVDLSQLTKDYNNPVLAQSIDGVGTKTIIARMCGKYDTLGHDLLSATSNDIVVIGAKPITLLDYVGCGHLDPDIVATTVAGLAQACQQHEVALIGGETAEMPDTYIENEYDLVGIVTGIVDKNKMINGETITPRDIVLGLHSSGLHTNGYSLARKLFFSANEYNVDTNLPEYNKTLGEVLLEPHINYTPIILAALKNNILINGMAHITGGGLTENIPRILPKNCSVAIDRSSWDIPPIFNLMQQLSKLDENELYRTFNMGIGYVVILPETEVTKFNNLAQEMNFAISTIGEIKST